MSFVVGTLLLAIVTAVACALPGVFVVLRKNSMLVDAISHAILPGIILGYFFTRNLDSPVLILGAALAGLAVVLGSEYLSRTGLITGDAPQGLIFPALFSIGVIMVTLNFADVHLDTHAVLVGDLNLAAFEHLFINGVSIGPTYLYVMLGVLLINVTFLTLFHRQMKVSTFDPQFAQSIGMRTGLFNTVFMFLVSLTVTAAFNAAGAILVIALMVIPAATAYLLTNRLPVMIGLTVVVAIVGATAGFGVSYVLDAATSAGMSVFYGFMFASAMIFVRLRERHHRRRGGGQSEAVGSAVAETQTALLAERPKVTSGAFAGRTVSASE